MTFTQSYRKIYFRWTDFKAYLLSIKWSTVYLILKDNKDFLQGDAITHFDPRNPYNIIVIKWSAHFCL